MIAYVVRKLEQNDHARHATTDKRPSAQTQQHTGMADCLRTICPCLRRRRYQYEAIDSRAPTSYYPTAQQAPPPPAGGGAAIGSGGAASSCTESPVPMLKGAGLPTWVPDDVALKCYGCAAAFDVLLHRRHHCRRCRNVVCGACSANERPVLLAGLREPVRVCMRCSSEVAREVSGLECLCGGLWGRPHSIAFVEQGSRLAIDHK